MLILLFSSEMEKSRTSHRKRKSRNHVTTENEEEQPWPSLGEELVSSIALHLSFIDRASASIIFPKWNPEMRKVPCLPYFLTFEGDKSERFKFFSPKDENKSRFQDYLIKKDVANLFSNAKLLSSRYGWLLIDRNYMMQREKCASSLIFYNPLYNATIELPPIILPTYYKFFNFCFSANPIMTQCIVTAGIFTANRLVRIIFCQRGHNEWTDLEFGVNDNERTFFNSQFASSVFYNEKFYWLSSDGKLGEFDPVRRSWKVHQISRTDNHSTSATNFLVKSGDNLFRVWWSNNFRSAAVYKLNQTNNNWEETQSLGGQCFFVGFRSISLSINTKLADMQDRIYFPMRTGKQVVYYDTSKACMMPLKNGRNPYQYAHAYKHACWVELNSDRYTCDQLKWF